MIFLNHLPNKTLYLWRHLTSSKVEEYIDKELKYPALFQISRQIAGDVDEDSLRYRERLQKTEDYYIQCCRRNLYLPNIMINDQFRDWRLPDWEYFVQFVSIRTHFRGEIQEILAILGKYEYFEYFGREKTYDSNDSRVLEYHAYFWESMTVGHFGFMKKLFPIIDNDIMDDYNFYRSKYYKLLWCDPYIEKNIPILDWLYEKDMEREKTFSTMVFDLSFFTISKIRNVEIISWIIDHCILCDSIQNFSFRDLFIYYLKRSLSNFRILDHLIGKHPSNIRDQESYKMFVRRLESSEKKKVSIVKWANRIFGTPDAANSAAEAEDDDYPTDL